MLLGIYLGKKQVQVKVQIQKNTKYEIRRLQVVRLMFSMN